MIGTYAKAAAALVPGAGRLPWVAGGGSEIPDRVLERDGIEVDRDHVADYARVCGFRVTDALPPTYPHILAFPLHMQLMTGGDFPFPAVGLVHLRNQIRQRRPVLASETLDVRVKATPVQEHPKGRTFSIVTEVRADGKLSWTSESTMLRRGGGSGDSKSRGREPEVPPLVAEWKLPGDLGRRYGAVSGDRNPIHIHPVTARLFGFPRPIAHGMWTKARALAAMRVPDAFTAEVEFRKPIFLPGTVRLHSDGKRFEVRSGDSQHMVGTVS